MEPTFDINDGKSKDWLLRVQYFSIGGDSWDRTASTVYSKSTANDHLLKIQGLFATLHLPLRFPFQKAGMKYLSRSYHSFRQDSGMISWAWATEFIAFESAKVKQASTSDVPACMHHLSVTVDGRLVLPLMSVDRQQVALDELLKFPSSSDRESEMTWVLSNSQLEGFGTKLREMAKEEEVRLKISVYGAVKSHPRTRTAVAPVASVKKNIAGPD
ncbi:hypothetical protein DFH07DRAFT_773991 [Mycena maculata]|uniref:Uncharacterized protein n=1 Tax=Mycena maculata TaxID=230809 RepID=A0AAD7J1K9_9AGAR|nr:hypothetical protein DFH07DRAFT_773991 [Mycena maculata]